ncbi:MAG: sigma-70 family RNA polymerase sigma factor [Bacteroidales bacterium]|jgi:RNA polymerase sigma-70 factor (ECF subfamily)|nr:sigma-70 family RNA polymerase sigma factor [Bacteroidales bacterium]
MNSNYIYIANKKYAFKALFSEFYASQVMFSIKIVGNKQDAEDIVQEVFLSIWKSNSSFKNEIAFRAYLYLSTRNKCIDFLRKKRLVNKEIDVNVISEEEIDHIVRGEAYMLLYKAIEKLPPQAKRVIVRSMKGLTVQEVADSLNISVNTVKSLKLRAYRTLRDLYGDVFIIFISTLMLH